MELESAIPEKPEKLSDKEQAVQRIMTQRDPRFPGMAYPRSAAAAADSITAGIKARPSAAKGKTREEIVQRLLEKIAGWEEKLGGVKVDPVTDEYIPKFEEDSPTRKAYQKLIDDARRKLKKLSPELEAATGEYQGPPKPEEVAGDGTPSRPYEIQESQEQFDALPSKAWFRLPGDPQGKARQKP